MELAALQDRLRASNEPQLTLTREEYKLLAGEASAVPTTTTINNNNVVSVTLAYQRSTIRIADCNRSAITVAFLANQAMNNWGAPLAETTFSLYTEHNNNNNNNNTRVSDAYLQECTYPRTLYIKTEQTDFADFTEDAALKYAGIHDDIELDDQDISIFPTPLAMDDSKLEHAWKDLELKHALYNPIEKGGSSTRREFISSILVLAASVAGVQVTRGEQLDGSAGRGSLDWMTHYRNHRMCIITEATDISKALIQNLAQLAAAGEGRGTKRAFCDESPLFGIATTYTEWIFLRLDASSSPGSRSAVRLPTMYINVKSHLKGDTKEVAERIAGILRSQKISIDRQVAKKVPKKPGLKRIVDASGHKTKVLTKKQRLSDKRIVGSAKQQKCYICRKYSAKASYTAFCCDVCATPLCSIDRTTEGTRKLTCVQEHRRGDVACRCDGRRKTKFPPEYYAYTTNT